MTIQKMFEYAGENGRVVSPVKLPMDYVPVNRLIAGDGKLLFNGEFDAAVVDVYDADVSLWVEIEKPAEIEELKF